jgi:hypothetical protein
MDFVDLCRQHLRVGRDQSASARAVKPRQPMAGLLPPGQLHFSA